MTYETFYALSVKTSEHVMLAFNAKNVNS
jgi:hypothetical protein